MGFRVHEEDFTVRDASAALPDRQIAATAVAGERLAERHAVDGDGAAVTAYALSKQRHDALEERYISPDIAALDHEGGERLGRHDGDQVGNVETVAGRDAV